MVPVGLGAAIVLSVLAVDPGVIALLLDVDVLAALGGAALMLLHSDVRAVSARIATSFVAVMVRCGVAVTRDDPRSLFPA